MSSLSKRTVIGGGLILAALAITLFLLFRTEPVLVETASVVREDMTVTVDEEARTRVHDIYIVSSPLDGRVARIEIEPGDEVIAGETQLAQIQPLAPSFIDARQRTELESQVRAGEAALSLAMAERDAARAELDFAISEVGRARPLAEKGTISPVQLERVERDEKTSRAALATAEALVNVRRHELERAKAALIEPNTVFSDGAAGQICCVPIFAPISGQVLKTVQESEQVIRAGQALMEIGDLADLEIVAELLSGDAVKVRPGSLVRIEDWGGGKALGGTVRRVEPRGFTKISALGIEEQRVNVVIDLDRSDDAWKALGHGYRVNVRIAVWHGEDVLRVPVGALFRDGQHWAVFVDSDGRAELRRIGIDHRNDLYAEVTSGLSDGEQVVLHPSDRIEDGTPLILRPAPAGLFDRPVEG
ncbi:MAG: HlyD family efflux transporter periplasmic adaptor subunit [Alphaproteobacteria bacterium]